MAEARAVRAPNARLKWIYQYTSCAKKKLEKGTVSKLFRTLPNEKTRAVFKYTWEQPCPRNWATKLRRFNSINVIILPCYWVYESIVYCVIENALNINKVNKLFLVTSCFNLWELMNHWRTQKLWQKRHFINVLHYSNCALWELGIIEYPLGQCFSNFFIPSPPFHSRHVVFAPQAWWNKHKVVN